MHCLVSTFRISNPLLRETAEQHTLPCDMQAGLFVSAGVNKIRLTGGEPTLRRDLPELVSGLSGLPGMRTVAMTSNGITLSKQLATLQAAGGCHQPYDHHDAGLAARKIDMKVWDMSARASMERKLKCSVCMCEQLWTIMGPPDVMV